MAGQRRFILFACLGAIILFAISFHPSSLEAVKQIPQYASNLSKSFTDKEALQQIAPEFAQQALSKIIHVETSSTATSASSSAKTLAQPLIPATAAAGVKPVEVVTSLSLTSSKSQEIPQASAHVASTSVVDPLYATSSVDLYGYLSSSHAVVPQETGKSKEAASASHSEAAPAHTPTAAVGNATHAVPATPSDEPAIPPSPTTEYDENEFGGGYWFFQADLTDYPLPDFDVKALKAQEAHNYQGPGHSTYATFLSTRNSSLQDPYFLATLQVAYRLLWDPRSKSTKHPFTVFVANHIPQAQRDYLRASGALVKELDLIEWHPHGSSGAAPRWRDMFTKLNMWAQTEFSRILYLDTDAFPLANIDELFDIAETRHCDPNQLAGADQAVMDQICDYTFTAVDDGGINAGMMILSPNTAMHAKLLRESQETEFDETYVEQSFLNIVYRQDGPFPAQFVDRKYNAIFTTNEDDGAISVIHEKIWALWFSPEHFAFNFFNETWQDMRKMYNTTDFAKLRLADGSRTASL